MKAIDTFLHAMIDYAGLFPPAALSMPEAVGNYAAYRRGADRAVLAAFVVPVARVDEMLAVAAASEDDPWPLSLLWTRGAAADAPATRRLRDEEGRVRVDAVELRASAVDELSAIAAALDGTPGFVEFPWREPVGPWVAALAEHRLRAKIRTGGVTADLIPPVEVVAEFLEACVQAGLPFKATAGLHHPVRAEHRLSYERDAPQAVMHGFLNVFLSALLLATGEIAASDLPRILAERDPAAFLVTDEQLSWRGRSIAAEQIAALRETVACSFGSCSFTEPLEDLHTLEMR